MIRRSGVVVSTTVAAGLLSLAVAMPAAASPKEPVPNDPRATVVDGNATTCEQAHLAGSIVLKGGEGGQYVTITVPDGVQLTGTVVKGGDAYNVYPPTALKDLRSPTNNGGNIPTISHWFACGIKKTETPPGNQPPGNQPPGNQPPGNGETGGTGAAPAPQGSNGAVSAAELANTGVSTTVPLTIGGALLLLMGAGLLLLARRARKLNQ